MEIKAIDLTQDSQSRSPSCRNRLEYVKEDLKAEADEKRNSHVLIKDDRSLDGIYNEANSSKNLSPIKKSPSDKFDSYDAQESPDEKSKLQYDKSVPTEMASPSDKTPSMKPLKGLKHLKTQISTSPLFKSTKGRKSIRDPPEETTANSTPSKIDYNRLLSSAQISRSRRSTLLQQSILTGQRELSSPTDGDKPSPAGLAIEPWPEGHRGSTVSTGLRRVSPPKLTPQKLLDVNRLRAGMQRFEFLLECSQPGTIPDAALLAALLDLVLLSITFTNLFGY